MWKHYVTSPDYKYNIFVFFCSLLNYVYNVFCTKYYINLKYCKLGVLYHPEVEYDFILCKVEIILSLQLVEVVF